MGINNAISIVQLEGTTSKIAHTPIHKYITQIIPYLEYRKDAAKKLYDYKGNDWEAHEEYQKLIEWADSNILHILNIQLNK